MHLYAFYKMYMYLKRLNLKMLNKVGSFKVGFHDGAKKEQIMALVTVS